MSTYTCCACNEEKPLSEFRKNKTKARGHTYDCKSCIGLRDKKRYEDNSDSMKLASADRYQETRSFIDSLKSKPCLDCGIQYPPYVMDFDHRPGVTKIKHVSQMRFQPKQEILAEAAKCDVVCSNCHRQRTHDRRQSK